MENKPKRDGRVGDAWNGLLGNNYKEKFGDLIPRTTQSTNASVEKYGKHAILIDKTNSLPVQVILDTSTDKLLFQSIIPKFNPEFEDIPFTVDRIDEWSNEAEAVLEGVIFEGHLFSFYCSNYLKYKEAIVKDKILNINISVVGRKAEILPVSERTIIPGKGPLQGETLVLDKMRYLNPVHGEDPELCQFFFPIQDIQTIKFYNDEILKIKGTLFDSDEEDKHYYYNVYINKSLVKNPEELKIGEPFKGWGWLQAEITGIDK